MENDERKTIVACMDGYLDALASITEKFRDNTAGAFCAALDTQNIDQALADHYADCCRTLQQDLPDLTVELYHFKPAEMISDWIGLLHQELEVHLLPVFVQELVPERKTLEYIQYNLAWQVMEMIRIVTDDFQSELIYRAQFQRGAETQGVIFVIPIPDTCLLVYFSSSGATS